jgi:hypothetical protein
MEWQVILVLVIVVAIILIPVALVWYLNIGGIYAAIREGQRIRVLETIGRVVRIGLAVIVPVGIYGALIWFFLGHFGWQVALAVAIVLPIVLFVPVLVWAVVVSGLYQVIRDTMRRRVAAPSRRIVRVTEEPATQEVKEI